MKWIRLEARSPLGDREIQSIRTSPIDAARGRAGLRHIAACRQPFRCPALGEAGPNAGQNGTGNSVVLPMHDRIEEPVCIAKPCPTLRGNDLETGQNGT